MTTAVELAAHVRSGAVSATEAVETALRAIERGNGEINAFVALDGDRALAEAAEIRPGDPRPLAGVPFGVKDFLAATEGLATTHGSAAFGDWVADRDAVHVARLRAAGAILVGKTNTPELGLRPVTEPARYGPTRNPRDTELMAGGSSGGSAAAVAAGFVPFCDGSDAGGSIRIPAACCGVVGMRPSRGLVPNGADIDGTGMSAVATFGPLARTVQDVAVVLDAMADADRFAAAAGRNPGLLPVRVALAAPDGVPVDDAPRAAAERVAAVLAEIGHDVVEGAPDWDDERFARAWMTLGGAGMRRLAAMLERVHGRPLDPDALEPATRALLIDMPAIPEAAANEAASTLEAYTKRVLADWPPDGILVTPTLARLPLPVGGLPSQAGVSSQSVRFSVFVRVFNVTGQPAITIPVEETIGVQIAGPPGRDDLVLAVAAQVEAALQTPLP
ncbi:MAG TPA: amidase [Solirubrobacteraceae bacterium]|nr:amidase [Solirubrobacteraceae bacterium]